MKKLTPMRAIRAKCVECSGGSINEPKRCLVLSCPLYPYREGHRPKEASEGKEIPTEEPLGG